MNLCHCLQGEALAFGSHSNQTKSTSVLSLERKGRSGECVWHSVLPLEVFPSLLLANVLFLINKIQSQGGVN